MFLLRVIGKVSDVLDATVSGEQQTFAYSLGGKSAEQAKYDCSPAVKYCIFLEINTPVIFHWPMTDTGAAAGQSTWRGEAGLRRPLPLDSSPDLIM